MEETGSHENWYTIRFMRCPKCGCEEDKVIDSRSSRGGSVIRRRRHCRDCGQRFTTYEEIERGNLMVIKQDGRREKFSKEKLVSGITTASQKRPISAEQIETAVREIIDELFDEYDGEAPTSAIGHKVMRKLKPLDGVAFVRYASIYRRFEDAGEFVQAVKRLEVRDDTTTIRLPGF